MVMQEWKSTNMCVLRVYILQPDDMPLKTVMMYGNERDRACEINVAFVARTRSYADLIYLRHLHPTHRAATLDLSQLWPSASYDTTSEEGTTAHEDEALQKRLECTQEIARFFDVLELPVPGVDEIAELSSSSQSRAVLRDAVSRTYKSHARVVHPDRALARTKAKHRLVFPSGPCTTDFQKLNEAFQKLNEAYHALKRWLEV